MARISQWRVSPPRKLSDIVPPSCDTILVSFQRSGANWVRYCTEYFSGRPTPGVHKLVAGEDFVFHRTHDVRIVQYGPNHTSSFFGVTGRPQYARVLLLVRNPAEVFVRQVRKHERAQDFDAGLALMDAYIANLEAVRTFEGEKLVVHYEDLIADFAVMERVLSFLHVSVDLSGFDLEAAKSKSTTWYDKVHGAHTKDNPLDFTFHSRSLADDERCALWTYLKDAAPASFDLFLRRYV